MLTFASKIPILFEIWDFITIISGWIGFMPTFEVLQKLSMVGSASCLLNWDFMKNYAWLVQLHAYICCKNGHFLRKGVSVGYFLHSLHWLMTGK